MSKITNLRLKGKKLVTSYGTISFDANGVTDVPEELAKELLEIKGFEPEEETKDFGQKTEDKPQVGNSSTDEETTQKNDESTQEDENQDEPEETSAEETPDFESLTVPQLKKYAKEHDIDLMGANKKDEIIPLIVGSNK